MSAKKLIRISAALLIAAAASVSLWSCKNDSKDITDTTVPESTAQKTPDTTDGKQTVGEGSTSFDFQVTDAEGTTVSFTVKTDKTTVGEALSDAGLIEGEEGQYGLYVKTVNGVKADYDTDGTYWAFYIDGEYAMTGVDKTDINENSVYELKIEK